MIQNVHPYPLGLLLEIDFGLVMDVRKRKYLGKQHSAMASKVVFKIRFPYRGILPVSGNGLAR